MDEPRTKDEAGADQARSGSSAPVESPAGAGFGVRTFKALDFDAVRAQVSAHATFGAARRMASELTPSNDVRKVEALQKETAEGRRVLEHAGPVDLYSAGDESDVVTRAALEGVLTGLELLAISEIVRVHRRAKATFQRSRGVAPLLAQISDAIPDLGELERQIAQIASQIGPRGEVVDGATPTLGDIRRGVREAYQRVTDGLTRIIQSSAGGEALQDQVIAMRGERFVLQVKKEMRQRVPGIVLDASNSGATLFVEPFATVDLCNTWRELALEEERETERVLRGISASVGRHADDIRLGDAVVADLDLVLARARYSMAIGGTAPAVGQERRTASGAATGLCVRIVNARHPLLGDSAVPVSLTLGPNWSVLVITGPNTGGKTVTMKTVGLLALMHQSGLQMPADEGTVLPVFDSVFADVGDLQSIEGSVSTFSSHMRNVIDILSVADAGALVLLDELGISTDPEEGSALAKAILQSLASRGVLAVVTTHYRAVAAFADAEPGMMNASLDLDPETLMPTYQVTMGVPGRSYAFSVAAQIGLQADILESARSLLEPQHLRFEDWLSELQRDRKQLQTKLQEAEELRARTEESRKQLEAQLDELAEHRSQIQDSMQRQAQARYEELQKRLKRAEASLSWSTTAHQVSDSAVVEAKARAAEVREEIDAEKPRTDRRAARTTATPLAVGDEVDVLGLNVHGTVVALPEQGGEAEVAIGNMRLRLDRTRLTPLEKPTEAARPSSVGVQLGPSLTGMELHLRGMRVGDAEVRLDEFLDKAVRDGLSSVRIIHGKGTGALRQAVREQLARHPLARSYAPEDREHGGDGATVVELM